MWVKSTYLPPSSARTATTSHQSHSKTSQPSLYATNIQECRQSLQEEDELLRRNPEQKRENHAVQAKQSGQNTESVNYPTIFKHKSTFYDISNDINNDNYLELLIILGERKYEYQRNWMYLSRLTLISYNYQPMIKTEQKGKRIHMTRTRPNFTIRSLIDQGFSSPQLFLQINSISPTQNSLSKNIKIRLEEEINSMLNQITRIINENQVNLREGMNYVRSSILFKEIDEINANVVNEIVGEFAKNKIEDLEMALQMKNLELERLKKQARQQQDFKEDNLKINKIPRISLPKQIDNELLSLYHKAKASSYEEFEELYKQIQCGNRLEFIQISTITPKEKRQSTKHSDGKEEKKGKLMKVLSPLLNNLSQNQRADLLEVLKQQLTYQCQNPCCRWIEPPLQPRNRMTALNFPRKQAKTTSFYKSDKVNQYYKRYYHSAFEVDKIRNVVKTQGDEIEKLYKVHKSKEKSTGKYRSHRCQSTV